MRRSRRRRTWTGLAAAALVLVLAGAWGRAAVGPQRFDGAEVFAPSFAGPDRLVTNEQAYPAPTRYAVPRSQDWMVTSGSLFARGGAGWSGEPDGGSPDAGSTDNTGSAVLRAVSKNDWFSDAVVTTQVRVVDLVVTERTPAHDWDGVHLFLRYSDADNVYTVDVYRRDGTLTIKRKSGGEYELLAETDHPVPRDRWVDVRAAIRTVDDGDVRITLSIAGRPVLTATDTSGEAITDPGRVGVRGDNCEFYFRDFRAWVPRRPPPPPPPSPFLSPRR